VPARKNRIDVVIRSNRGRKRLTGPYSIGKLDLKKERRNLAGWRSEVYSVLSAGVNEKKLKDPRSGPLKGESMRGGTSIR